MSPVRDAALLNIAVIIYSRFILFLNSAPSACCGASASCRQNRLTRHRRVEAHHQNPPMIIVVIVVYSLFLPGNRLQVVCSASARSSPPLSASDAAAALLLLLPSSVSCLSPPPLLRPIHIHARDRTTTHAQNADGGIERWKTQTNDGEEMMKVRVNL